MMNKIAKGSLLQFIYTPLTLVLVILTGEDLNSIMFATLMSFLVSIIMFLYNFLVTLLFSKVIGQDKLYLFLTPFFILVAFYSKVKEVVHELDFGGGYITYVFLLATLIVNLLTYFYVNKKNQQSGFTNILDS